jgi:light-regulated signal transduction histidine kinase (bacteriophytochrome)
MPDGSQLSFEDSPVQLAIQTQKPVEQLVLGTLRHSGNKRVWLQLSAVPLINDRGDLVQVICSFIDITEQKRAADKMEWLYRSLESRAYELAITNTDLEKFVYAATHDLQEPLRRISGFIQILDKRIDHLLDEQSRAYFKHVLEGSSRMKKLILDLLDYASVRTCKENFSDLSMLTVVEKVRNIFSETLCATGAKLECNALPSVNGDEKLLVLLLEKLVGNSLQYRSERPLRIIVDCREDDTKFCFTVTDNGIGIESGYREKVFNLFQRLNANETYDGTGVGLAICQKIIRLHQGDIGVNSVSGTGSRFWFTIPKKTSATHEKA